MSLLPVKLKVNGCKSYVSSHLGISEERQRLVTKERDVHIITKSKEPKTVSNQTSEECVMSDDY